MWFLAPRQVKNNKRNRKHIEILCPCIWMATNKCNITRTTAELSAIFDDADTDNITIVHSKLLDFKHVYCLWCSRNWRNHSKVQTILIMFYISNQKIVRFITAIIMSLTVDSETVTQLMQIIMMSLEHENCYSRKL